MEDYKSRDVDATVLWRVEYSMDYICPMCRFDQLSISDNFYNCGSCHERYRIIDGIPDFRIYPFPYSDNEEAELSILLRNFDKLTYVDLYKLRQGFFLRKNGSDTELEKVRELHQSSLRSLLDYHMDGSDIFSTNMKRFRYMIGDRILHGENAALELGCGRGTQLHDMLSLYKTIVAIDNSLAELIVAKKLLQQKGIADRVRLVCACSESMPFIDDAFDAVNMRSVLEHVEDQERSLQEVKRILRKNGILLLETPNRFTLQREPHVKVFGVGFVPRKWMKKYVDLMTRKQITFGGIRSLSYFELRILLTKSFGNRWEHRIRLIDESRPGVSLVGKFYRKYGFVRKMVENLLRKFLCPTHYVAAWKK